MAHAKCQKLTVRPGHRDPLAPIWVWLVLPLTLGGCALDKLQSENTIKTHDSQKEQQLASAKPAPAPQINSQTHLAAGRMLEKQGDLKGALAQYEKAVVARPKHPTAYNRLGIIYEKLGRYKEAENVFRHGIDVAPNEASLRNNLGYCYLVQRRFDDAQEQFTAALAVSPTFQRARMNLGIVFAQTGRLQKGLVQFRKVVGEDAAQYNLAVICLSAGDYENAEKSLKHALAANPNLTEARQKLDQLYAWAKAGQLKNMTPQNQSTPGEGVKAVAKTHPPASPITPLAGTADEESAGLPR